MINLATAAADAFPYMLRQTLEQLEAANQSSAQWQALSAFRAAIVDEAAIRRGLVPTPVVSR